MSAALLLMALLVLLTVVAALARVVRGRQPAERLLGAQLMGTGGVATLLLLEAALEAPGLGDAALVFAVLAAVTAVAYVRRGWQPPTAAGAGEG